MTRSVLALVCALMFSISCSDKSADPTAPTPPTSPAPPTPPAAPTVASVSVSGTSSFATAGQSQFTAMVTPSNGTTEDRTSTASWQSSNTAVATVSAQGLVTVLA